MVSGYSFFVNDIYFGITEKNSRKEQFIYSRKNDLEVAKNSKRKPPAFEILKKSKELSFYQLNHLKNQW